MAQVPTAGTGVGTGPGSDAGHPPAGEVQVDGNTLSSDGAGNMDYQGADGSSGSQSADGSSSYQGPEGSGISGQFNADGSGSWTDSNGDNTTWEAGEEPPNDLPGMEGLGNIDAVANSPEGASAAVFSGARFVQKIL